MHIRCVNIKKAIDMLVINQFPRGYRDPFIYTSIAEGIANNYKNKEEIFTKLVFRFFNWR